MNFLLFIIIFPFYFLFSVQNNVCEEKLKTLYNRIDSSSLSKHLAFYELYSDLSIGKTSLDHICNSLMKNDFLKNKQELLKAFIEMINKPINQKLTPPSNEVLREFEEISKTLPHYHLKGHHCWKEEEILVLSLDEIDLARGILINQFGDDRRKIAAYEMSLDLMAIQVLNRLPEQASSEDKIRALNFLIFDELGFRFPPHSISSKKIDIYTNLPSVLDSRRGVCLGVSVLYLCLAQRLNLSLEMITPPGHIYVRYRSKNKIINIETTARGVHIDSKEYLTLNTSSLQQRTIREVIGLVHFNQASVFWQSQDYDNVVTTYEKAKLYMEEDPLLKELMGYALVITGQQEKGLIYLQETVSKKPTTAVSSGRLAEDFLKGEIDPEGIKNLFLKDDDERTALLKKKERLEEILKEFPHFRLGIAELAETWLKLHRQKEALEVINRYLMIDFSDPEMHYYASMLYTSRNNYPKAWEHLQEAEKILESKNYKAKELIALRRQLIRNSPEERKKS